MTNKFAIVEEHSTPYGDNTSVVCVTGPKEHVMREFESRAKSGDFKLQLDDETAESPFQAVQVSPTRFKVGPVDEDPELYDDIVEFKVVEIDQ